MNDISNFLAKQLDALKLSKPVVPILGSLNDLVGTVLITTMALIGTRTTSFLK